MTSKQSPNHADLRYLRLFALAAGTVAIVVGLFVLFGWMFDLEVLKSVLPGRSSMKPNTALCFVLSGLALVLVSIAKHRSHVPKDARHRAAFICSSLVAVIALATLSEYLFAIDLKIDALLCRDALLADADKLQGGRMAGATAMAFAFLGAALMWRDARYEIGRRVSEVLSFATLVVGLVALIGYAYRVESLYRFQSSRSMAVHTALLFFLLGLGTLCARPKRGVIAVLTSDESGRLMSRRVLPLALPRVQAVAGMSACRSTPSPA